MIRDTISIQGSPPETLVVFDCRGPGAKNRLHSERRAWGARASVEALGSGRVVMIVRPGGAAEVAK